MNGKVHIRDLRHLSKLQIADGIFETAHLDNDRFREPIPESCYRHHQLVGRLVS